MYRQAANLNSHIYIVATHHSWFKKAVTSRHLENTGTFLVFVSSLHLHTGILKGNVPTKKQCAANMAVNTCHSTKIVVEY
jgi:hypothetical protein